MIASRELKGTRAWNGEIPVNSRLHPSVSRGQSLNAVEQLAQVLRRTGGLTCAGAALSDNDIQALRKTGRLRLGGSNLSPAEIETLITPASIDLPERTRLAPRPSQRVTYETKVRVSLPRGVFGILGVRSGPGREGFTLGSLERPILSWPGCNYGLVPRELFIPAGFEGYIVKHGYYQGRKDCRPSLGDESQLTLYLFEAVDPIDHFYFGTFLDLLNDSTQATFVDLVECFIPLFNSGDYRLVHFSCAPTGQAIQWRVKSNSPLQLTDSKAAMTFSPSSNGQWPGFPLGKSDVSFSLPLNMMAFLLSVPNELRSPNLTRRDVVASKAWGIQPGSKACIVSEDHSFVNDWCSDSEGHVQFVHLRTPASRGYNGKYAHQ